jgi:hypothetical protein
MYVFSDNKLTSVIIPSSMTRIADAAFAGNLLTSVTISYGVERIAAGAFSNNKLTSLSLPNSLRAIGYGSFGGNLLTSVIIPASVTEMSWYAFSQNLLTSVKFEGNYPGGADAGVFDNNPDLEEVNVPVGSTGWGYTYDGLLVRYGPTPKVNPSATPKVPGTPVIDLIKSRVGNQTITVHFRPALRNGGSRITNYLVEYKAKADSEWTTFSHPASTRANPYVITGLNFETTYDVRVSAVNAVGTGTPSHSAKFTIDFFTYAVDGNDKAIITGCVNEGRCKPDLVIPATIGGHRVRAIGWRAFEDKRITSVVLPSTLENIGYNAFAYNGLMSVVLPKSLKTIDEGAFYSNALTSLVLPNSVTSVGYQAFRYNKLTSLVISKSLTSIGDITFANNRLTSLTIPSWVTSVGEWAFSENLLTSVRIPSSVKTLGKFAFATNQLTSVSIPSSLTRIDDAAFATNQLTSVNIPQSVTSIGPSAFAGNKLASLRLPNSVAGIGDGAFARNNLTSLVIPASVREISYHAFASNKLTSIKFAGNYPAYGMWVLDDNPGLTEVKVAYGTTGWGATYAGLPVRYVGGPIIQQASAPKIVKAKLQNGQVTLRIWAPRRVDPMGITGYEYTLNNGVTWAAGDATSVDKSLVITGLTNGTRYVVKVRAVSGLVRGMPSSSFPFTPRTVASAPTITALTGQDGSIKVEFAAPASNGGSAITRYAYSVNGKQWFNWGASTSPQVIKALHNRVVCSIRVRALNAAGWGAPSEAVEATPHR